MSDYTVRIVSDTQNADRELSNIEKRLKELEKQRRIPLEFGDKRDRGKPLDPFKLVNEGLKTTIDLAKIAAPVIAVLYQPLRDITDAGRIAVQAAKGVAAAVLAIPEVAPGRVMANSFDLAGRSADGLVKKVASIGFTTFGVTQAVNTLRAAYGGMFDETIGREIQLRDTILQTKTALISTADVAVNNQRVIDPTQALKALDKPIDEALENIRKRSLEIAGTTSDAIIDVFAITSQQIAQIGGSIKDAEDMALSFAGALGVLGMSDPTLANQEIRSIFQGNINQDSRLAVTLGITNKDIEKAKNSAEGLIKFLERRLAGFTAGQKEAAMQFYGITSNLVEIQNELSRAFGKPFLDPLLEGLTGIYERLTAIVKPAMNIADAMGRTGTAITTTLSSAIGAAPLAQRATPEAGTDAAEKLQKAAVDLFLFVDAEAQKLSITITNLANSVISIVGQVGLAVAELAKGLATFKFEEIKAMLKGITTIAGVLSNTLIPALSQVLKIYGQIVQLPIIQALAQQISLWKVLESLMVMPAVRFAYTLVNVVIPAIKNITKAVQAASAFIKGAIDAIVGAITTGVQFVLSNLTTGVTAVIRGITTAVQAVITVLARIPAAVVAGFGQIVTYVQATFPQLQTLNTALLEVQAAITRIGSAAEQAAVRTKASVATTSAAAVASAAQINNVEALIVTQAKATGVSIQAALGQAASAVGGFVKGMALSIGGMLLTVFAIQAAITLLISAYSAFTAKAEDTKGAERANLALTRLSTTYKDVGENATAAQKAAVAFERTIISSRVSKLTTELGELKEQMDEVAKFRATEGINSFGELLKIAQLQLTALFSEDALKGNDKQLELLKQRLNTTVAIKEAELERLTALETITKAPEDVSLIKKQNSEIEEQIKQEKRDNIQELFDYEQQINKGRITILQQEFQLRATYAAAAEKAVLRGLGGQAAEYIKNLLNYLSVKKQGEENIEVGRMNALIEKAELEKKLENFKFDNAKRIAELQKEVMAAQTRHAQWLQRMAQAEAIIRTTPPSATGEGEGNGAQGTSRLATLTRGRESGGHGMYDAINRGGVGDSPKGSQNSREIWPGGITNMEVGKVRALQDAGQIHAAGAYQFIGGTLKGILKGQYGNANVLSTDKFNEETQNKLFQAYANYVLKTSKSIEESMARFRATWIGAKNIPDTVLKEAIAAFKNDGGSPGGAKEAQFGKTGHTEGVAPGFAHTHLQNSDRQILIRDASKMMQDMLNRGYTVAGSNADIEQGQNASYYNDRAARGIAEHKKYGPGVYALDLNVKNKGDATPPVPGGLVNIRRTEGAGGVIGTIPGSTTKVMHLDERSLNAAAVPGGGAAKTDAAARAIAAAGPPPAEIDLLDLVNRHQKAIEVAERQLAAQATKLRAIGAKLDEARTADALDTLLKDSFKPIDLEPIKQQAKETQAAIISVLDIPLEQYTPVLASLKKQSAEAIAAFDYGLKRSREKLDEMLKQKIIKPEDYNKQIQNLAGKRTPFLKSVAEQEEIAGGIKASERVVPLSDNLGAQFRALPNELASGMLDIRASVAKALAGDDLAAQRIIEKRLELEKKRLDLELELRDMPAKEAKKLRDNFAALSDAALANVDKLNAAAKVSEQFLDRLQTAREIAASITGAQRDFLSSLAKNGSFDDALKGIQDSVSSKFLDMAMNYAFKPIEENMRKQMEKLFGVDKAPVNPELIANTEKLELGKTATEKNTTAIEQLTTAISLPAAPTVGPQPLTVIPFGAPPAPNTLATAPTPTIPTVVTTPATPTFTPPTPEGVSLPGASLSKLTTAADGAAKTLDTVTDKTKPTGPVFTKLQETAGFAMSALGGIAQGIAGVKSFKEGGAYGVVSGLAGIFGALGSMTSLKLPKFATGAFVTGPTIAQFGEGGESEYAIPSSRMADASMNYLAGKRGSSVLGTRAVLDSNKQQRSGGSKTFRFDPITISTETHVINNQEFVSKQDHSRDMQRTAQSTQMELITRMREDPQLRQALGMN
jgi:hypothetical protein